MDEGLIRTIKSTHDWPALRQLEVNIKSKGRLDEEVRAALRSRSTELAIPYIQERTGLALSSLTEAQRKIVAAVGKSKPAAAALHMCSMRKQGCR